MEKILIVAVVAFLFFGPDKLPELARTVGKFMREFKKVQEEMETTIRSEMYKVDLSPVTAETTAAVHGTTPPPAGDAAATETATPASAASGWAEDHEEESEE